MKLPVAFGDMIMFNKNSQKIIMNNAGSKKAVNAKKIFLYFVLFAVIGSGIKYLFTDEDGREQIRNQAECTTYCEKIG